MTRIGCWHSISDRSLEAVMAVLVALLQQSQPHSVKIRDLPRRGVYSARSVLNRDQDESPVESGSLVPAQAFGSNSFVVVREGRRTALDDAYRSTGSSVAAVLLP